MERFPSRRVLFQISIWEKGQSENVCRGEAHKKTSSLMNLLPVTFRVDQPDILLAAEPQLEDSYWCSVEVATGVGVGALNVKQL